MGEWKRTERREISPFDEAPDSLSHCSIRLREEDAPDTSKETFLLEDDQFEEPILAFVTFSINSAEVSDQCRIPLSRLGLALTIRDPAARSFRMIAKWPLATAPTTFTVPEIRPQDFGADGLDLSMSVVLTSDLPADGSRAHAAGSILATRSFSIRRATARTVFQVKPVDFRENRWPADALWFVEFHETEDFDLPPERVATIWVNRSCPRFVALLEGTSGQQPRDGRGLRYLVAAEAYSEIAQRALASAVDASGDDSATGEPGLRSMVVAALSKSTGNSEEALVAIARNDPSRFRLLVQGTFGVGREYRNRGGALS